MSCKRVVVGVHNNHRSIKVCSGLCDPQLRKRPRPCPISDVRAKIIIINERLAKIRIKAKFHNISQICAHASTEDKDDAFKDAFYANLKELYDKCPVHDIKIVLGGFNAKVGQQVDNLAQRREPDRFRSGAKHGNL